MEFRQLKYFTQIAEDQNYSIAAKKLYITQPTLSWTIKHLEEELDVKLFVANGKKLQLTTEGEELLQHAKHLLAEQQEIIELFQHRKDHLTGHIQLGVPEIFGTCFFMDSIMRFMSDYPKVKVSMINTGSVEVQDMVEAGKLELGMVSYVYPSPTLDAIELPNSNYPIVLIVSKKHPLATKESVAFPDLKQESFVLLTEQYTLGKVPIEACQDAGFTPNVVLRSTEWGVVVEAVANSNNVTVLPYPLVEKIKDTNIAIIPIHDVNTVIPIAFITKKNHPRSLPLQKFIQFMLNDILNSSLS